MRVLRAAQPGDEVQREVLPGGDPAGGDDAVGFAGQVQDGALDRPRPAGSASGTGPGTPSGRRSVGPRADRPRPASGEPVQTEAISRAAGVHPPQPRRSRVGSARAAAYRSGVYMSQTIATSTRSMSSIAACGSTSTLPKQRNGCRPAATISTSSSASPGSPDRHVREDGTHRQQHVVQPVQHRGEVSGAGEQGDASAWRLDCHICPDSWHSDSGSIVRRLRHCIAAGVDQDGARPRASSDGGGDGRSADRAPARRRAAARYSCPTTPDTTPPGRCGTP